MVRGSGVMPNANNESLDDLQGIERERVEEISDFPSFQNRNPRTPLCKSRQSFFFLLGFEFSSLGHLIHVSVEKC